MQSNTYTGSCTRAGQLCKMGYELLSNGGGRIGMTQVIREKVIEGEGMMGSHTKNEISPCLCSTDDKGWLLR